MSSAENDIENLQSDISSAQSDITNLNNSVSTLTNTINALPVDLIGSAALINLVYPIGSIFISTSKVNPSTYLTGTTWALFAKDQFLFGAVSASDISSDDLQGGASTVTLSIDNLPPHTHTLGTKSNNVGTKSTSVNSVKNNSSSSTTSSDAIQTALTGDGIPFSIMPPYIRVYIWQRTA